MTTDISTDEFGRPALRPHHMTKQIQLRLRDIIQTAATHCPGAHVEEDYSGRFMYGDECLGVVVNNPVGFAMLVGQLAGSSLDLKLMAAAVEGVQWDTLGLGYVVYWPSLCNDPSPAS